MDSTLAQKAYQELCRRMARGELPPGTRLVNRTLAKELGISFTPIREAINLLASQGLVNYVRGAGAFVRKPDRRDMSQLYDVRELFEGKAAEEAARHMTDDELDELQRCCDSFHHIAKEIRDLPGKVASPDLVLRWADREEDFHSQVIRASRNVWLAKIAEDLRLFTAVFAPHRSTDNLVSLRVAALTWGSHRRLVKLLRKRDPDAAREWMQIHIRVGRQTVLQYFSEQESEAPEGDEDTAEEAEPPRLLA